MSGTTIRAFWPPGRSWSSFGGRRKLALIAKIDDYATGREIGVKITSAIGNLAICPVDALKAIQINGLRMSALWERGLREGRKPSTILQNTTRLSDDDDGAAAREVARSLRRRAAPATRGSSSSSAWPIASRSSPTAAYRSADRTIRQSAPLRGRDGTRRRLAGQASAPHAA